MEKRMKGPGSKNCGLSVAGVALTILVVAGLAWAGNEPWKTKPYQQWDDKDIFLVLTNSPWSHLVVIETTWKPLTPQEAAGSQSAGSLGPVGSGHQVSALPAEHEPTGTRGADAHFNVYWMSSRTMREAVARRAIIHDGKNSEDADKFVSAPLDYYEIVVQGEDMAPFFRGDEKFFAEHSLLEMKKSKQTVAPSGVTFEHGPDGKSITAAVFHFPKKLPSGEPVIAPDEKNIQFSVKIGGSTLRADFDLQKMADQKGSDL